MDRYGNEIEADLHERFGLDLVDFHREWDDPRRLSRAKLYSLVKILERRGDSYLTWARGRDTEVYRAASRSGSLSTRRHRPESFEMTEQAQIAAGMFKLLQDVIRVTSRDKKFKPKPWPMPETAADLVKREDAEAGYASVMDDIVFLPAAEFAAHVERHRGEHPEIHRNGDN